MSEGYPLLTLPANETYQLAHVATYIASAIARRRAATGRNRAAFRARAQAVRDLAAGREAFGKLTHSPFPVVPSQLPQPLDVDTFKAARELLSGGPRWAEVVSLAPTGGSGWAMLGHVPGLGPVGARVHSQELAEALRQHVLTRPAGELAPWAVTDRARRLPVMPHRVDLTGFVGDLDPRSPDARAVAAALRGTDQETDTAIGARFSGIDLDAPAVVRQPTSTPQPVPVPAHTGSPTDRPAADSASARGQGSLTAAAGPESEGGGPLVPDHGGGTPTGTDAVGADVARADPAAARTACPSPHPRVTTQAQQAAAAVDQQAVAQADEQQGAQRSPGHPDTRTTGEQGRQRRVSQPSPQANRQREPQQPRQRRGQPAARGGAAQRGPDQPQPDGQPATAQPGTGAQRRAARIKAGTRWTTYRRQAAAPAQPPRQPPGQAPAPGRG